MDGRPWGIGEDPTPPDPPPINESSVDELGGADFEGRPGVDPDWMADPFFIPASSTIRPFRG
jgi:hypothetical protein